MARRGHLSTRVPQGRGSHANAPRMKGSRSASRGVATARWVHWAWAGAFGIWALFVSGLLAQSVGSPGIVQAVQLFQLLSEKKHRVDVAERKLSFLKHQEAKLLKDPVYQEKEIRRSLGYVASDELVFEFH